MLVNERHSHMPKMSLVSARGRDMPSSTNSMCWESAQESPSLNVITKPCCLESLTFTRLEDLILSRFPMHVWTRHVQKWTEARENCDIRSYSTSRPFNMKTCSLTGLRLFHSKDSYYINLGPLKLLLLTPKKKVPMLNE
jgi:hypothetical protein